MVRNRILALAVAVLTPTASEALLSQRTPSPGRPTRVPVTLALIETPSIGAERWVVQRRPDLSPHDVIVLHPNVTADELSDAVRALLTVRQVDGDTSIRRAMLRVRPEQRRPDARRPFPWTQGVLADIRRAMPQPVAGIGNVRAVQIWLPPQGRGRATR